MQGHEDKHTEDRMPIPGRGKQEVSPGGGRTGIGANPELCVSGREYQHIQEGSDKDVERRIVLARGTWQALGKVWNSKDLRKATKTLIHEVLVLSTQLYNAESWSLREKQKHTLRVFEMA